MARKKRKSKSAKRKIKIGLVAVAAMLLLGVAAWGIEQYYRLEVCNFQSYDGESHGYYVYPDMSADSLLTLMQKDYRIGSMTDWRWHRRHMVYIAPQTGYYRFPARIGDKHLIRRLQLGQETPIKLTWTNQVRTRQQLAARISQQLLLDSAEIADRMSNKEYMRMYGLTPETAICMFLPNTYEVYWTCSGKDLFDRMYSEYRRYWNNERIEKAKAIGLSETEVATLASIVESETNNRDEMPIIASLYINRIRRGMPLQACPTVIYATGNFRLRRVLKRHLQTDSPYNTYKYAGLPPGPIRCANGSTMDAVLAAPETNYLYMCANPNFSGTHIFSSSYGKHAATARQYQQELNKKNIK